MAGVGARGLKRIVGIGVRGLKRIVGIGVRGVQRVVGGGVRRLKMVGMGPRGQWVGLLLVVDEVRVLKGVGLQ